jgi:Tfp pilus assembly protein PilO
MKRLHILLIVLAAVLLVGYFLVWPAFQEMMLGRDDLAAWQQKLAQAQESKKKLGELETKYQSVQDEEDRILQALPPSEDIPGLLIQMEALASQNGLIMNSLNFIYPPSDTGARVNVSETEESIAATGSSLPAGVKVLSVNLNLNGNYSSLKNFLKAAENNLRLTDVSKISFSQTDTGSESGILTIGLSVYYKQ